jgi:hypothetical protein
LLESSAYNHADIEKFLPRLDCCNPVSIKEDAPLKSGAFVDIFPDLVNEIPDPEGMVVPRLSSKVPFNGYHAIIDIKSLRIEDPYLL